MPDGVREHLLADVRPDLRDLRADLRGDVPVRDRSPVHQHHPLRSSAYRGLRFRDRRHV